MAAAASELADMSWRCHDSATTRPVARNRHSGHSGKVHAYELDWIYKTIQSRPGRRAPNQSDGEMTTTRKMDQCDQNDQNASELSKRSKHAKMIRMVKTDQNDQTDQ